MENIKKQALLLIEEATTLERLDEIRIQYVSKKGEVSSLMSQLKDMKPEERASFGSQVNLLKQSI